MSGMFQGCRRTVWLGLSEGGVSSRKGGQILWGLLYVVVRFQEMKESTSCFRWSHSNLVTIFSHFLLFTIFKILSIYGDIG